MKAEQIKTIRDAADLIQNLIPEIKSDRIMARLFRIQGRKLIKQLRAIAEEAENPTSEQ